MRTINVVKNTLYPVSPGDDPKLIAKRVAALGRDAFRSANNCGKKTLAEIEAWINKYGYSWEPGIARPKGQAGHVAAVAGDAVEPI